MKGSEWHERQELTLTGLNCLGLDSFYPLYPPSADVPLDLSLAPEALEIALSPDILLMPSDLTPFVKVNVNSTDQSSAQ